MKIFQPDIFLGTPMKNSNIEQLKFEIELHLPKEEVMYSITPKERLILAFLTRTFNPEVIFETGTCYGISTLILALASTHNCLINTFDIPNTNVNANLVKTEDRWGEYFRDTIFENKIIKFAVSTNHLKKVETKKRRVLWFIDSSHDWNTIEHETGLALNSIFQAGLIIYHDANEDSNCGSEVYKYLSSKSLDFTLIQTESGIAYIKIKKEPVRSSD